MKAILEGTVVAFPLEPCGWGLGVVARLNWRERELVVYAYSEKFQQAPSPLDAQPFSAAQAIFIKRVSDKAVRDGRWKVLGLLPGWDRNDWPMPNTVRRPFDTPPFKLVKRSDLDPTEVLSVTQIDEDRPDLPSDGCAGYGYFESFVSDRINARSPPVE